MNIRKRIARAFRRMARGAADKAAYATTVRFWTENRKPGSKPNPFRTA